MTTIGRSLPVAALGLLATAPEARADSAGELAESKATAVLSEMASGKQDTDIPREMLARARAGSFGPQLGGQVTDLVLIVMSEKGIESLLKSETTLGGDVSLTARPKSLHEAANTDGSFKAEIFSYARSTGFFAGASFEGATVQPDGSAIRTLYGAGAASRDVLTTYSPPPKKR
jgi:lipid-binding SYLF domain-containing protein